MRNIIECDNLVKIYKTQDTEVVALQGLNLEIQEGEMMAIIGNSGSGKSTLLNMLGGLDRPSAGRLIVDGRDLLKLSNKELVEYSREVVGFVWQNNARNLIPYLSALDNVEIPMILTNKKARRKRALELLDMVGLADRRYNKLSQLSGGEQQRVAIAIALSNNPKILLADEPTGSVDTRTTQSIMELLRKLNRELGVTIVIVTHDRQLSRMVNRVVAIQDGRTSSEFIRRKGYSEALEELISIPFEGGTHEELIVLDRGGRLQLPRDCIDKLGLSQKSKLKLEIKDGSIVLAPVDEA